MEEEKKIKKRKTGPLKGLQIRPLKAGAEGAGLTSWTLEGRKKKKQRC